MMQPPAASAAPPIAVTADTVGAVTRTLPFTARKAFALVTRLTAGRLVGGLP